MKTTALQAQAATVELLTKYAKLQLPEPVAQTAETAPVYFNLGEWLVELNTGVAELGYDAQGNLEAGIAEDGPASLVPGFDERKLPLMAAVSLFADIEVLQAKWAAEPSPAAPPEHSATAPTASGSAPTGS